MEPVKIGIVGVGGMGGSHATSMHEIQEVELTAVADVSPEVANRVAESTGAKAFTSYEEMIRKGGIEAVLIATPHFFHPPMAEYAARHGVHVLSEKPVAVTVAAADKMIKTCKDKGVKLGVMFQQRTDPARRKIREMVQSGVLGELHRVAMTVPWYRPQAYYDSGAWRGTWKGEGGGVLMNQAPHNLDQFVWLGGMPQSVQALALTRHHKIEVDNTALAIFDYGNGKVGWLYVSTAELSIGERVELAGEKGALVLDNGKLRHYELEQSMTEHLPTEASMFGSIKGEWHDVELEDVPFGHIEVTRAFARAIRANDDSLMVATGEDGLRALEIANAMLLAGFTHREVELPVNRGKFERMLKKLQQGASPAEFKGK